MCCVAYTANLVAFGGSACRDYALCIKKHSPSLMLFGGWFDEASQHFPVRDDFTQNVSCIRKMRIEMISLDIVLKSSHGIPFATFGPIPP